MPSFIPRVLFKSDKSPLFRSPTYVAKETMIFTPTYGRISKASTSPWYETDVGGRGGGGALPCVLLLVLLKYLRWPNTVCARFTDSVSDAIKRALGLW